MDLESSKGEAPATNGDDTQQSYTKHKESYEKLRADVAIKMQFLDENRVSKQTKSMALDKKQLNKHQTSGCNYWFFWYFRSK